TGRTGNILRGTTDVLSGTAAARIRTNRDAAHKYNLERFNALQGSTWFGSGGNAVAQAAQIKALNAQTEQEFGTAKTLFQNQVLNPLGIDLGTDVVSKLGGYLKARAANRRDPRTNDLLDSNGNVVNLIKGSAVDPITKEAKTYNLDTMFARGHQQDLQAIIGSAAENPNAVMDIRTYGSNLDAGQNNLLQSMTTSAVGAYGSTKLKEKGLQSVLDPSFANFDTAQRTILNSFEGLDPAKVPNAARAISAITTGNLVKNPDGTPVTDPAAKRSALLKDFIDYSYIKDMVGYTPKQISALGSSAQKRLLDTLGEIKPDSTLHALVDNGLGKGRFDGWYDSFAKVTQGNLAASSPAAETTQAIITKIQGVANSLTSRP
ncbi:MAG TPA: hypothetical protein VNG90_02620, partial [Candidatus Acidoferrum sp.]|nr:hypothetical protein [Candidatus Acidoferrum sp.]